MDKGTKMNKNMELIIKKLKNKKSKLTVKERELLYEFYFNSCYINISKIHPLRRLSVANKYQDIFQNVKNDEYLKIQDKKDILNFIKELK